MSFILSLRPQELLRSIIMSTSVCVCVSVCLSVREDISGTTRAIFTIFFVFVAYGRGSVPLRQGDESKGEGTVLGDFLPY